MSSFLYPNSATRKLFGQAGEALKRQNKRFIEYQRKEREKRIKDLAEAERLTNERAAAEFKRVQRRERIVIGIVAGIVIASLLAWLIFF